MAKSVKTFVFEAEPNTKCTITLDLSQTNLGPAISITGTIVVHNPKTHKYETQCAGQCLNTMIDWFPHLMDDETFATLYDLWTHWHLNDMQAGTPAQTVALDRARKTGELDNYDYTKSLEYLKTVGLYSDEWCGSPYVYGTGWLHWPLPDDVITTVTNLLES